ncbi:MAG: SAM-dependent methyltransferase [Leptolinea sp.]|nr:SAM-dependent methyltransferase [Leptolinea sp.]
MAQIDCVLSPLGYVRSSEQGFVLEIKPEYREAMLGLQGFSHINVLWWSHLLDGPEYRKIKTVDKPYAKGPDRLGIFATRSPMRPNPICLDVAQVLHIDETNGQIVVAWIDAEDGTPILDIKPYLPCSDRVKEVSTPAWNAHWPAWYEESGEFDWASEFVNAQ